MRVLFWGTPEFAAPPLRALIGEGFDVVGVVTQPDKPVGRSRSRVEPSPVKVVAQDEGLVVLQPERPRGEEFLARINGLAPDISVVVAYGHILPTEVIDAPRLGTINIHASLLPVLRGAAPIQAAIREGHVDTGITIMRMVRALDAGPSILQTRTPIPDDETYGELQLRLAEMGAVALIEALALLELGRATETPQDDEKATYAPKVDRTMTRIDWNADPRTVARAIRAYDPKPGALTHAPSGNSEVKLFGARVSPRTAASAVAASSAEPGTVLAIDGDRMIVACGRLAGQAGQGEGGPGPGGDDGSVGAVDITSVHPAGKRRITPLEWCRGRGIGVGERLF